MRAESLERLAERVAWGLLAALGAAATFLAVVVPYHATDALVYGRFSRVIGIEGGYVHDFLGASGYPRPLFLAPQGWLWHLFGAHEWIGRLLSLAFGVALVWVMVALLRRVTGVARAGLLAVAVLLALPDFVLYAFAGQTDVPVAVCVGLAGYALWGGPSGARRAVLLGLAGAAAVLAKPTALPGLIGLGAAQLLGERRGLRERVVAVVPLGIGVLVALAYEYAMARHFDISLRDFLSGVDPTQEFGFTKQRIAAMFRAEWLGPYLRPVAAFAAGYAIFRIATLRHRTAVVAGVAVCVAVTWIASAVLPEGVPAAPGPASSPAVLLASVALPALLLAARWCPESLVPSRLMVARLALWAGVPLVAWSLRGYLSDTRTLAAAWPPMLVLVGLLLCCAIAALPRERLMPAAVAVLAVIAVADLRNLDGLGVRSDGSISVTRALRHLGPSTWGDPDAARAAADPLLAGMLDAARAGSAGRGGVVANDGRLVFYWPTGGLELHTPVPTSCDQLRGRRVLALLTSTFGPAEYGRLRELGRCPGIRLVTQRSVEGSYIVARIT